MMDEIFCRTEAMLGTEAMKKLKNSRVALFGLGGVGSAAFEALVRSGVGTIDVFDHDTISLSNLNRQLLATLEKVDTPKTEAGVARAKEISPETKVIPHSLFYLPDSSKEIDMTVFDYVIDAVDTVTGKLEIILNSKKAGVPVISCMGTGNKLDITALRVSDISKTEGCPLARVMRKELRSRGITELPVVWSDEKPFSAAPTGELKGDRPAPASAIFVPAAAGLILAAEAVKHISRK